MTPNSSAAETSIANSLPDRLLLDRHYDIEKVRGEVYEIISSLAMQFYIDYSVVPLASEIEDPPAFDWDEEPMLEGCPYLKKVFSEFETEITSIRLMRMASGFQLAEHSDPTLDAVHREVVRLTVPVFSDDLVTFLLNGTEVPMKPGELWYLKLSERHSVQNHSPNERINMSIDVAWNPWVEGWLASVAGKR